MNRPAPDNEKPNRPNRAFPLRQPAAGAHRGEEALQRVERILEVAKRMLIEQGYQKMSLNAILRESGGSKATISKYFGNKAGLLQALLGDEAAHCIVRADAVSRDQESLKSALQAFAMVVLQFFCQRDSIQVSGAIAVEKLNDIDTGRNFYRFGYSSFVKALAKRLDEWHEEGLLAALDSTKDAERFLGMLRSGPNDWMYYGIVDEVSDAELQDHAEACASIFLRGRAL